MDLFIASAISSAYHFFEQGGIFMIFLLLLSVIAGTVMILRGMALRQKTVLPPQIAEEIERLPVGGDLARLEKLIARHPSPLGRVAATVLKHLNWPRSETVEAVQTRARHEVARLETGLAFLEIATGISPLLGLLGTLSGLVVIFGGVGADPAIVARGIAEALNCTIVGLGISVPCLITHNHFQRRIELMSVEMESLLSDLMAKCYPQGPAASLP
jgi:biopolymer transport protein ExbB